MQTFFSNSSNWTEYSESLAALVAKNSFGNLTLNVVPEGRVTDRTQMLAAINSGALDAGFHSLSYDLETDKSFGLFSTPPFIPPLSQFIHWAAQGEGVELLNTLLGQHYPNIVQIACAVTSSAGEFWSRKPINTPADLQGLRIRQIALQEEVYREAGADTVNLLPRKMIQAFRRNELDALTFATPGTDHEIGFHQKLKNYYYPAITKAALLVHLTVNKDRWNAASPEVKAAVRKSCLENLNFTINFADDADIAALADFKENGVQIQPVPLSIETALRQAWQRVLAKQASDNPFFVEVYQSISRAGNGPLFNHRSEPAVATAGQASQAADNIRLEPIDTLYVTTKSASVRKSPHLRADKLMQLAPDTKITALGKVSGKNWFLLEKDGEELGYVFGNNIRPAGSALTNIPPVQPTPATAPAAAPADLRLGTYHALVIGNNDYKSLQPLNTAVRDARAVAQNLRDLYGYEVTLLENATRSDILVALLKLRRSLTFEDNLLIYYAGHGWLDRAAERGYWLPVDAAQDDPTNWVSNVSITDAIRAMEAKHIMVVADSCYSGTLTRGTKLAVRTPDHIKKLSEKNARTVLTSGGLEPVVDGGGNGHSVFANAFLNALSENTGVIDGHELFNRLRRPVMLNSDQTPQYSDMRKVGHEGGDFLFVRQ